MINPKEYGGALFALAQEQGCDAEIFNQTLQVRKALEEAPDYVRLLDSPSLPKEQRLRLLDQAFVALNPYHLNFLKILCEKHAVRQYVACTKVYGTLYDQTHQILRAEAVTAVPMTRQQLAALEKKLRTMTGKTVVLSNPVSPEILGGVALRMDGVQLEGSIRSRLEDLRERLASVTV